MNPKLLQKRLLSVAIVLVCSFQAVTGQVEIRGTVYDQSLRFAMPGVSVIGTSGGGTVTDSAGQYQLRLSSGDSIYFSYLGRATARFPVRDIVPGQPFDMSLQVAIDSLPSVYVHPRNYEADSLENRREYQKIFDYGTNYLDDMKMGRGGRSMGVGIDMDMLFEGRKIRRMEAFQHRLEEEERDKYVDHRFTRYIVKKITGLEPPALDTFMRLYRPSYELIQSCQTDYEYYHYIQDWGRSFSEMWKREHPEGEALPFK